jgi:hypothetical protein
MREVDQIVVPLGTSTDIFDLTANLESSIQALGFLILAIDNDVSVYTGPTTPLHAIGEYIDYLESVARTIHEVLYDDEREGSTHE